MPKYDNQAPPSLIQLQEWFGAVIGTPINSNSTIQPTPYTEATAAHISPSEHLLPLERIEVYNQQYWWRLLNALQENFPLLTRLFGTADFNESIGKPALRTFPPSHWCLSRLGEELVRWVDDSYTAPDRNLVLDVSRLDWSITSAMTAGRLPPLSAHQIDEQLLNRQLHLQPHLTLHHFRADLITFRETLLQRDPDGWIGSPLPSLDKSGTHHFAVYRNRNQTVTFTKLAPAEFELLTQLASGHSLAESISLLPAGSEQELPLWCQQWTARGWLSVGA